MFTFLRTPRIVYIYKFIHKYALQYMNAVRTGSLSYSASDDEGETVAPGLDDDNFKVLEGKLASGTKRTWEWERKPR